MKFTLRCRAAMRHVGYPLGMFKRDRVSERARHEADGLRRLTWGEYFPVDPVQIARRLGVQVLDANADALSSEIAGAIYKELGHDPVILLNLAADSVGRKRLICAHLLGHFVGAPEPNEYFYIDRRNFLDRQEEEERFATAFARALLSPARESRRLRRKGYDPLALAAYFDLPREALAA